MVGQAARGERQGSGWDKVKNGQGNDQQYNNPQYANRYSRHYQGMDTRGSRNNPDNKVGLISTPVDVYKKLLKKVGLFLFSPPVPWEP